MKLMKTYNTDRMLNAGCISPTHPIVMAGGGVEAKYQAHVLKHMDQALVFNMVLEEQVGRFGGHFGPINAMDMSRDGTMFATGGEDSIVRLHKFSDDLLELFSGLLDATIESVVNR